MCTHTDREPVMIDSRKNIAADMAARHQQRFEEADLHLMVCVVEDYFVAGWLSLTSAWGVRS